MADQIGQALQHLRGLLLADTALTAKLASGAIYLAAPRTEQPKIPMPCIIFQVEGGVPGFAAPIQQLAVQVAVYSRTSQAECFTIFEMARKILDMARLHSDVESNGAKVNPTSGYCRITTRPTGAWAEETQSWYCQGRFTIYTATAE